jgi:hypothetical protein
VGKFNLVHSIVPQGYLKSDQTHKNAYAGQLSLSPAKEAAPEPEVAPVPRRTFIKVWALLIYKD